MSRWFRIAVAAFLTAAFACGGLTGVRAPASGQNQPPDPWAGRRERMVATQIMDRGIRDPRVLAAMRQVPRHEFVPPERIADAYNDHPLPIGAGQTISQPYIVAYMSELLELSPNHRILEIGTGSGYQAAVLSLLAAQVYSMEIVATLGEDARARLDTLGYHNVNVRIGNGYSGWPDGAPFDRILLTAAPREIPSALLDQLANSGRLVAPVGPTGGFQEIVVVDKDATGRLERRRLLPVRFVPMVAEPDP